MALSPDFFQRPIPLKPHFSQRPWGGRRLAEVLCKNLPDSAEPIGESWELSDHPDGRSTVVAPGSEDDGMTFGDLLRAAPQAMIDREVAPERYPLLVKYIDASGDLSVQVHPDDQWCRAKGHDDRGKSECWYVMDCPPGTKLIHGYVKGATEATAREALAAGRLGDLLQFKDVEPGDFLPVPPRTVHSMLTGLLVCEIQQSSNTTFRLYDWDRKPPRALHIEESMEVTEWDAAKVPPLEQYGKPDSDGVKDRSVIDNEFFQVTMIDVAAGESHDGSTLLAETGAIVNVVAGSGILRGNGWVQELRLGETYYLPAAMKNPPSIEASEGGLRLLRTQSREL